MAPRDVLREAGAPSMEEHMTDLLNRIVAAHGGLDRWAQFNTVQTTIVTGGALWAMKGLAPGFRSTGDDGLAPSRKGLCYPLRCT